MTATHIKHIEHVALFCRFLTGLINVFDAVEGQGNVGYVLLTAVPEQEDIFLVGKQLIDVFFGQLFAGFDEFNYVVFIFFGHASIIDGSRLSFSKTLKFAHNDMRALEKKLKACDHEHDILIVVDGIFSMEGDIANLPKICELAEKYHASVMVDDAHSLGVIGEHRSGTASHFGLTDKVELIMGTFSKSLASLGGYIAADREVIDYIKHNSRSMIFSASMTPASVGAALAALNIMEREPERTEHLWDVTNHALKLFKQNGFDTGHSCTPIIPLLVRDDDKALGMTRTLLERGVFINPVISPAVPQGRSLIRFSLMATHTFEQVDEAVEKITVAARELHVID